MLTYDVARKELRTEYFEKTAHLDKHRPLFSIGKRIAEKWSNQHEKNYNTNETMKQRYSDITYAVGSSTINCLSVNLRLGSEDSIIKDVGPEIEDLRNDKRFEFIEDSQYLEMGWKGWRFKYKETGGILLVRAWFEKSTKCELKGTGKFEEIKELVCEE